jgi:hypothetical protein
MLIESLRNKSPFGRLFLSGQTLPSVTLDSLTNSTYALSLLYIMEFLKKLHFTDKGPNIVGLYDFWTIDIFTSLGLALKMVIFRFFLSNVLGPSVARIPG